MAAVGPIGDEMKAAVGPIAEALMKAAKENNEKNMALLVFDKDCNDLYSTALDGTGAMILKIVKSKVGR